MRRFPAGLLTMAGFLAACGGPVRETSPPPEAAAPELEWPAAPLPARVRFVEALASPRDLGVRRSLLGRIADVVHGGQADWFVRPAGVAVDGDRIYVADPGASALWILNGPAGRIVRVDAAGGRRLASPVAVAPRGSRGVYVADSDLGAVFLFEPAGTLIATTVDSGMQRPAGVAYDAAADRLYVADSAAHRVWVFTGDGDPLPAIGRRGIAGGEFNFPTHVAVGGDGTVYVTDALGFRIHRFSREGRFLDAFGRHGDGSGDFAAPKGVAVDSDGHVYVVDALFDAVQIFDRRGRFLLGLGRRGVRPGEFWLPGGVFIDRRDRIYVADSYNRRIQVFQYLKIGRSGDDR